jgi:hypothetical protein
MYCSLFSSLSDRQKVAVHALTPSVADGVRRPNGEVEENLVMRGTEPSGVRADASKKRGQLFS